MKLVWLCCYLQPVLIEQSILGFVVLAVQCCIILVGQL